MLPWYSSPREAKGCFTTKAKGNPYNAFQKNTLKTQKLIQ